MDLFDKGPDLLIYGSSGIDPLIENIKFFFIKGFMFSFSIISLGYSRAKYSLEDSPVQNTENIIVTYKKCFLLAFKLKIKLTDAKIIIRIKKCTPCRIRSDNYNCKP